MNSCQSNIWAFINSCQNSKWALYIGAKIVFELYKQLPKQIWAFMNSCQNSIWAFINTPQLPK